VEEGARMKGGGVGIGGVKRGSLIFLKDFYPKGRGKHFSSPERRWSKFKEKETEGELIW